MDVVWAQVLIFPSAKGGSSLSSANVWLHVVGSHAETDYLHVPRGIIHFSFWARYMGVQYRSLGRWYVPVRYPGLRIPSDPDLFRRIRKIFTGSGKLRKMELFQIFRQIFPYFQVKKSTKISEEI